MAQKINVARPKIIAAQSKRKRRRNYWAAHENNSRRYKYFCRLKIKREIEKYRQKYTAPPPLRFGRVASLFILYIFWLLFFLTAGPRINAHYF